MQPFRGYSGPPVFRSACCFVPPHLLAMVTLPSLRWGILEVASLEGGLASCHFRNLLPLQFFRGASLAAFKASFRISFFLNISSWGSRGQGDHFWSTDLEDYQSCVNSLWIFWFRESRPCLEQIPRLSHSLSADWQQQSVVPERSCYSTFPIARTCRLRAFFRRPKTTTRCRKPSHRPYILYDII